MSYRLIDANEIAIKYPEVNEMDCIYVDLPNGLDNEYHYIDAEPKHGRWEQVEVVHDRKDAKIQDWQQAKCSVCGRWHTTPFMYYLKLDNYCPNCGAKMDEVEE